MPFDKPIPRPFTAAGVRQHAPALPGVYGISNSREWIYIGESFNIQEALLRHLQEPGTAMLEFRPTGFVSEVCDAATSPARHARLLAEYQPACNSGRLGRQPVADRTSR